MLFLSGVSRSLHTPSTLADCGVHTGFLTAERAAVRVVLLLVGPWVFAVWGVISEGATSVCAPAGVDVCLPFSGRAQQCNTWANGRSVLTF